MLGVLFCFLVARWWGWEDREIEKEMGAVCLKSVMQLFVIHNMKTKLKV
jgi:hypothetical protein